MELVNVMKKSAKGSKPAKKPASKLAQLKASAKKAVAKVKASAKSNAKKASSKVKAAEKKVVAKSKTVEKKVVAKVKAAEKKVISRAKAVEKKVVSKAKATEKKVVSKVKAAVKKPVAQAKAAEKKVAAQVKAVEKKVAAQVKAPIAQVKAATKAPVEQVKAAVKGPVAQVKAAAQKASESVQKSASQARERAYEAMQPIVTAVAPVIPSPMSRAFLATSKGKKEAATTTEIRQPADLSRGPDPPQSLAGGFFYEQHVLRLLGQTDAQEVRPARLHGEGMDARSGAAQAGGSGIKPIHSLIRHATEHCFHAPFRKNPLPATAVVDPHRLQSQRNCRQHLGAIAVATKWQVHGRWPGPCCIAPRHECRLENPALCPARYSGRLYRQGRGLAA